MMYTIIAHLVTAGYTRCDVNHWWSISGVDITTATGRRRFLAIIVYEITAEIPGLQADSTITVESSGIAQRAQVGNEQYL